MSAFLVCANASSPISKHNHSKNATPKVVGRTPDSVYVLTTHIDTAYNSPLL